MASGGADAVKCVVKEVVEGVALGASESASCWASVGEAEGAVSNG